MRAATIRYRARRAERLAVLGEIYTRMLILRQMRDEANAINASAMTERVKLFLIEADRITDLVRGGMEEIAAPKRRNRKTRALRLIAGGAGR